MIWHCSRWRVGTGALEGKGGASPGDGALGARSKLFGPIEAKLVCSRRGIVRRDSWMLDVACLRMSGWGPVKAGPASDSDRGPGARYGNLTLVRVGLGHQRCPLVPMTTLVASEG